MNSEINPQQIKEVVSRVGKLVLEDWGMTFADQSLAEEIPFAPDDQVILSKMNCVHNDKVVARVAAVCSPEFAKLLCSNVLGDEDSSELSQNDVLGELVNIFGGHFITEGIDQDDVIHLTAPDVKRIAWTDCSEISNQDRSETVILEADDFPVLFFVKIEQEG
jgi:hypothetical protein